MHARRGLSPSTPLTSWRRLRMLTRAHAGGWDKNSTAGKHSSSMLVQTVASEGLADAFMAFNTNYHDSGLFGVYGVTDRERCEDFAAAALSSMTKLCFDVSEADVVRAKNQLKASLMFFQDSTHRESARTARMRTAQRGARGAGTGRAWP